MGRRIAGGKAVTVTHISSFSAGQALIQHKASPH
jgi:hypothetical protein